MVKKVVGALVLAGTLAVGSAGVAGAAPARTARTHRR